MNEFSHFTAINRDSKSFPLKFLQRNNLLKGKILDFGCGLGTDADFLKTEQYDVVKYDPFYYPEVPTEKFDTILCFYVLNVLLPEEQEKAMIQLASWLKPDGKAFIAVRRDIQYEGYRMHKLHLQKTYQCKVYLDYNSLFKNENCEIYEFQHYAFLNRGNDKISPFFKLESLTHSITETKHAFAFFDKFPVNRGHALIVPKRLISNYFDLSETEQMHCWKLVNHVQKIISEKYKPDGFNVGLNIHPAAGQTVFHCHIHIIPRYENDVENPRGGIRGVIPTKKDY